MTAKEHLMQIRQLNNRIVRLTEEIERRRAKLTSTTISTAAERVQSSPHGDKFAGMIAALADKELYRAEMVLIYETMRDTIVDEILGLDDELCQSVLFERYVNGLEWGQVAAKLFFSPSYIYVLHLKALASFSEKYPQYSEK